MLVLGGGKRFYFYANKKANFRNEIKAYNAFPPYNLLSPFLRLFQRNISKKETVLYLKIVNVLFVIGVENVVKNNHATLQK